MSYSAIVLLPLTPPPFADCRYLDRCYRALTSDGCASCRLNFTGLHADSCDADSGSQLNLVAITLSEASR